MANGTKPTPKLRFTRLEGNTIRALYQGYGKRYNLSFGDGVFGPVQPGRWQAHTYPGPGRYWLMARDTGDGSILDGIQVIILPGEGKPVFSLASEPVPTDKWCSNTRDDYRHVMAIDTGALDAFYYKIDWGTGETDAIEEHVLLAPGGKHARWGMPIGTFQITVTNETAGGSAVVELTVLDRDDPAIRESTDPAEDAMTIGFTITQLQHVKPVTIDWGDGNSPQQVPAPQLGQRFSHTYSTAGDYLVEVSYSDGTSTSSGIALLTVPWKE